MAKVKTKSAANSEKSELVSFKLSRELYEKLGEYAETQVDEAGLKLSPSQAARRLMLDALKRLPQKK